MRLAYSAILVRAYDEAIDWFVRALGFEVVEDTDLGGGKRWVVIAAPNGGALLLARAKNEAEQAAVGNQHGGRVGYFLHCEDFTAEYRRMLAYGVAFVEAPRAEAYGKVVVFRDLYGNKWDLVERKLI